MPIKANIWYHRGYKCGVRQKKVIGCRFAIEGCNLWMPREFLWDNGNVAECKHYIDLIAAKRMIEARAIEDKGLVKELVYDTSEQSRKRLITINPIRLLAMLRGEEFLEIPLDTRIRVADDRLAVRDIDAAILSEEMTAEYIRQLKNICGTQPIIAATITELKGLKNKYSIEVPPERQHSAFNLALTDASETRNDEAPPEPMDQIPISGTDHGSYTETVSLITVRGKPPYFVRRLIRDRYMLWSGTSFHANGPWTRYYTDPSRLAALGITP